MPGVMVVLELGEEDTIGVMYNSSVAIAGKKGQAHQFQP
jgi:hypothetical protein